MDISQALRLINQPGSPRNSGRSSSAERNLDLIYLSGGVPIVRIEAWLANLHQSVIGRDVEEEQGVSRPMCRDLTMVSCVYGGQLTVGLTIGRVLDGTPGVELILNAMLQQVGFAMKE